MTVMMYILPLICAAIGFYLSTNLAMRARIRPLGILFLASAAIFWACIQLGRGNTGWDGIGYTIVALLVIIPFAIGLIFGMIFGLLRRRRALTADD